MAVSNESPNPNGAFNLLNGESAVVNYFQTFSEEADKEELYIKAEKIVSQPPEQKLTSSQSLFEHFIEGDMNFDDMDVEDLPEWIREIFTQIDPKELFRAIFSSMSDEFSKIQEKIYDAILTQVQDVDEYVIISAFFSRFEELLGYIMESGESEENPKKVLSLYSILASHYILISGEQRTELYPELIEDLFYYERYFSHAVGIDSEHELDDLPLEVMKQHVLLDGAVNLYQERDISVDRGAEIVGINRNDFEKALIAEGVRPNYGPETVDELREFDL